MRLFRRWQFCNLCGIGKYLVAVPIEREGSNCSNCSSVWRTRAVGQAISIGLGKSGVSLHDLEPDWSQRILGIGDSVDLASSLGKKFNYTNTHLDEFPILDLSKISYDLHDMFDIVSCSEILEHVLPPVDTALENLYRLLKPGGFAVISVPLRRVMNGIYKSNVNEDLVIESEETIEYYPGLISCKMEDGNLHWSNQEESFVDFSPEVHGGGDAVVAYRLWSIVDLIKRLKAHGFEDVFEPKTFWNDVSVGAYDAGILIARKPQV
jgi:SAM-dependent methyltransferase